MLRRASHSKREEISSDLRISFVFCTIRISVRLKSPPTHKKLSSMVLNFFKLSYGTTEYDVHEIMRSLIQYFNIYVHYFNNVIDLVTLMKLCLVDFKAPDVTNGQSCLVPLKLDS